jgi:peptidyl-prolyl cis-trans isomerase A (cyclophilin A)
MKTTLMLGVAFVAGVLSAAPMARAQDAGTPAQPEAPKQEAPKETAVQHVLVKTSMGDIVLELNREKAPISTDNFLAYVDKKFYDNTVFHRVIPGFMIQGGGFTPELEQKKTGEAIKNEWQNGLKNDRGTVAMARVGYLADSATAQFFINTKKNDNLDRPNDGAGYAVFGKVVAGMDVVDKIEKVPTTVKQKMRDVPEENVVIQTVRRITPEEAAGYLKPKS